MSRLRQSNSHQIAGAHREPFSYQQSGVARRWADPFRQPRIQVSRLEYRHGRWCEFRGPDQDAFHLSEAEHELVEGKDKDEDGDEDTGDNDKKRDELEIPDPVELELDGIENRIRRLTLHSADFGDAAITPDGDKVLYLAEFEKGYDLWVFEPRKQEIKLLAKLKAESVGGLFLDAKGKTAYVLADRCSRPAPRLRSER